ncbi:MAG TPA: hypothetical protein VKQ06_11490 [Gammaproteobacteria bacterium]|nr:hypothetical protein [Gammaproteobacteria bacterium]
MLRSILLRSGVLAAACALAPVSGSAQTRLNFVSCPIVRDTATVPCWLTEHDGELYYMGIQTDVSAEFHPPYLGHKVLVEATVANDKPRICGGIVLDPIRISVMPELDASCDTILPAESQYTIDFNPRPPGPSGGRLAFQAAPGDAPPPPEPASGPKTFHLYFDIDRGVAFRHPRDLVQIFEYADDVAATRVTVRGNRGATLLSDGSLVSESEGIAERRARQVAELLGGLGVEADIRIEHSRTPLPADGIDDWMSRSVSVHVEP